LGKRAHARKIPVGEIAFGDPHVEAFPLPAPRPAELIVSTQLEQQTPPTGVRRGLGGIRMREGRVLAEDVSAVKQLASQRHIAPSLVGIAEQSMDYLEHVRAVVERNPLALGKLPPESVPPIVLRLIESERLDGIRPFARELELRRDFDRSARRPHTRIT
jgi:hypothetical protein